MEVVVIKKEEIVTLVKKRDAWIIYTRRGPYYVCEPKELNSSNETVEFQLKGRN